VPRPANVPAITLATAHPAKFPDAVARAIGLRPALPPQLADLLQRPERAASLPNDIERLKTFVRDHVLERRPV
jgi:threonine synthase